MESTDTAKKSRKERFLAKLSVLGQYSIEDYGDKIRLYSDRDERFIDFSALDSNISEPYIQVVIYKYFTICKGFADINGDSHYSIFVNGKGRDIANRIKHNSLLGAVAQDYKIICMRNLRKPSRLTLINYGGKMLKYDIASTIQHTFYRDSSGNYVIAQIQLMMTMDGNTRLYEVPILTVDGNLNVVSGNNNMGY